MIATERQTRMASKLYECRDAARTLLGEKYCECMTAFGDLLHRIAKAKNCSVLAAAQLAADASDDGFEQVLLLAAAVEIIEPSA